MLLKFGCEQAIQNSLKKLRSKKTNIALKLTDFHKSRQNFLSSQNFERFSWDSCRNEENKSRSFA